MTFRELLQLLTGRGRADSEEVLDAIAKLGETESDWHHVMASWDMGTSSLAIDDKPVQPREDLKLPDDLGKLSAQNFFDLYVNNELHKDMAVEATRRKFIDKDGRPVYLMNGDDPPIMQLPMLRTDDINGHDIGDYLGGVMDSKSGTFSVWMTTDREDG